MKSFVADVSSLLAIQEQKLKKCQKKSDIPILQWCIAKKVSTSEKRKKIFSLSVGGQTVRKEEKNAENMEIRHYQYRKQRKYHYLRFMD